LNEVKRELTAWSALGEPADFISVTGSGEPTLHSGFGDVLEFIKSEIKIRSALLTNSTLLYLPEVRKAAAAANVIKVTLSAWDEESFRKIARPHPSLRFASVVEGLRRLRDEYAGAIWMEVFVVPNLNSDMSQLKAIANLARTIRPDRIHLNTAVRPPPDGNARAVSSRFLYEISTLFEPQAEVIAAFMGKNAGGQKVGKEVILSMLKRRPCTAGDVAASFSLDMAETQQMLQQMLEEKLVRIEERSGEEYYIGL
jgi:wyosine [tRNA(Phe)-imidazoG37] synthetase (radical SAM superfamily)